MGRRFDEVTEETTHWSYKVVKGDNNTVRIDIDGRLYTPQEISAMVLQKMKKQRKTTSDRKSVRLSLLYLPTSMMPSARLPKEAGGNCRSDGTPYRK